VTRDQQQATGTERILVVEADPARADGLCKMLERHDYPVRAVHDGREAASVIRRERPSVVIAGIVTPRMNGYELCRWIRARRRLREVAVILVTALGHPAEVITALECGADGLIAMPCQEADLLSRLHYITSNRPLHGRRKHAATGLMFGGQQHMVDAPHGRLLDLLVSAYQIAVQKNAELCRARQELHELEEQIERRAEEITAELKAELRERTRAEEELRRSHLKYRSIVENFGIGVCLISPDMEVLEFNRRMKEWFPRIQVNVTGRCYDMICEAQQATPCPDCPVVKTLRDGRVHESLLSERRGGATVSYRIVSSPVRDAEGKVLAAVAMVDDVSRLTAIEQQLGQTAKLEAMGLLAGGIAHDFNNLLVVINGYSRMIIDALDEDSPLRRDAEQVLTAGQRAARLTRQLLAFSRHQNPEPVVLNINHLTEGLSDMLQRIIGEDVVLRCGLSPDLWNVRADPAQIEQVLMNLTVNARDAMPQGGRLTIETRNVTLDEERADAYGRITAGPYVMLAVSDTGCGIPPEARDHIFDPFFTTKGTSKGTGLGLAMVYGTVRQHGGAIRVHSKPGRGTTFKIYLPRAAADGEPLAPAGLERPTGGSETILLVEDEEAVRSLTERVLAQQGYEVLSASGPREAEAIFERHENAVALLLTDVVMPDSDGPALYARLRARNPELCVLYVSGHTESKFVRHGFRQPEADFLQKPFTPEALARKVREVLDAGSPEVSRGRGETNE